MFLTYFGFFFCLDTKETKSQGLQIKRLKNYVSFPFRAPSRSPSRLNSRSADTQSFLVFLISLFDAIQGEKSQSQLYNIFRRIFSAVQQAKKIKTS